MSKKPFETVDTASIRQVVPAPEGGKYDYFTDYLDKAVWVLAEVRRRAWAE